MKIFAVGMSGASQAIQLAGMRSHGNVSLGRESLRIDWTFYGVAKLMMFGSIFTTDAKLF